jgi:hypothetical protein
MPVAARAESRPKEPAERLALALSRPVPETGLAVTVELDGLARKDGKAAPTLRTHVDGDALSYEARGGRSALALDAGGVVYDLQGRAVFTWRERVGGELGPDGVELAKRQGFRYTAHVEPLEPGLYQARVGFLEPSTGRVGTAAIWFEVPEQKD